jgi:hypothetical protein
LRRQWGWPASPRSASDSASQGPPGRGLRLHQWAP